MSTPPLPAGYALDQQAPPLPDGYKMDTPKKEGTGFLSHVGQSIAGMIPSWEDVKKNAGETLLEGPAFPLVQGVKAARNAVLEYGAAKQRGHGPAYSTAAATSTLVGVNPERMERAANQGDTAGVLGEAAVPTTLAVGGEAAKAILPSRGVANALRKSATKDYEAVLNPTKETTKYQTNKIMPQLLDERPTALTREGLAKKSEAQADIAGQQVESAVQNLSGSMRTKPVIDGLENLKKQYQVNGVSLRPEVNSAIDMVTGQLKKMGPDVSYQDAVKARRILDQAVAEVKGYQGKDLSDSSLANIRKETANAFRSELGKASPDLAAANAKFHFWNTLNEVIEQTISRKTGQRPSLGAQIQTAAAGTAGLAKSGLTGGLAYGAAMKLLGDAVHSTGWQTASANLKLGLADAMANGNFARIPELLGRAGIVTHAASPDSTPSQPVDNQESQHE